MWTQFSTLAPSNGTQLTPGIAARNAKLSKPAELVKPQLRESSRPLTERTFVEKPRIRALKRSVEKTSCASVLQKNSVSAI